MANSPRAQISMRVVVVGSTNPVKIAAATAVVHRVWPDCIVRGVAAASGVADQPVGDADTKRGALNRATAVLAAEAAADAAIGLEGGVVIEADGSMRTCAWAVVVDRLGRVSFGGSLAMPLPESVASRVRSGEELGYAMDAVAKTIGTKHGRGAVGILTASLIDRQRAYEPLVTYALAPWLSPEYFAGYFDSSGR